MGTVEQKEKLVIKGHKDLTETSDLKDILGL